ncbi:MAG: hypothetical protein LAN64_01280 [Acidobacteriia bacterium]|nr:hypothetical protein [Terriglobia bacterium]
MSIRVGRLAQHADVLLAAVVDGMVAGCFAWFAFWWLGMRPHWIFVALAAGMSWNNLHRVGTRPEMFQAVLNAPPEETTDREVYRLFGDLGGLGLAWMLLVRYA